MIKLGYFVPEFPGQTHIFFWRELSALRSLGANVSIVSTRKANLDLVNHDFAQPASKETFYLHPPKIIDFFRPFLSLHWLINACMYILGLSGWKSKFLACYFLVLAASLRSFCKNNKIDHMHGHSCANVAHILAMASLVNGPTYSLTLHGGLSTYGNNHKQKFLRAHFVSAVTRPLQQDIIKLMSWPESKVPVISMGVDIKKFVYEPRPAIEKPIHFISVARLARGKGHRYSLEALARLKSQGYQWRYTIVGNGPDESFIRDSVRELGLDDWVVFKGSLGEEAIIKCLSEHHILLLTSYGTFEAAPVCVMEAMAMGLPTITSIIGGTTDMITHKVDGFLVPQKSVDDIESAMTAFLKNPSLIIDMGKSARQTAISKFSDAELAKRLIDNINKKSSS